MLNFTKRDIMANKSLGSKSSNADREGRLDAPHHERFFNDIALIGFDGRHGLRCMSCKKLPSHCEIMARSFTESTFLFASTGLDQFTAWDAFFATGLRVTVQS